ncbi:Mucin-associated surface protein (MASP) subgroup S077 [Trypanosoma cruzi]|uniref:Mucin-associated surface protein (MASP) subgroup S077 n=1 Tax=Trypanosoma cruzi TaxID=5693 RepID=A0A7J6XZG3_TRYCR|nr:Mucin-associated surface protein (MASP) subgroup S077 [Trypanosoma cruzi]
MAMMMTGRVLLVCALCVLWCVTVFGAARDNRSVEGDGNVLTHTHNGGNDRVRLKADFGLISTRMGLIKAVAAGDDSEDGIHNALLEKTDKTAPGGEPAGSEDNAASGPKGGNGAAGAEKPSLPASGPGVPGTGDENRQSLMAGQKGNEKKNLDPGSKEPRESQDQTTDQLSSSSGSTPTRSGENPSSTGTSGIKQLPRDTETKGDVDPRNKSGDDGERDEEETGREKEENKLQPEKQERGNNGEVPQSLPAPPPLPPPPPTKPSGGPASSLSESEGSPPTEPKNSQNPKKVTNENTPSEFKTDSEATQRPLGDATQGQHSHDTDTEDSTKNAAAGSPAEPTSSSTSTSGSGDHVQNKADEDDAQNSEEQHDSLETGNTNVVPTLSEAAPQTAKTITTANTTDTAPPSDSDGSTAVSHTTSPLLLLLLVACAAAAAVVTA